MIKKHSKQTLASIRVRYSWHLQPGFRNEFDRSHWWKGLPDSDINPVGALYELARRHPVIGEIRSKFHQASWYGQELRAPLAGAAKEKMASHAFDDLGKEPKAIHCLCLIGLKSWPELDWRNQEFWEMSAGKMKGLDCRANIERCSSITSSAHADVLINRSRFLPQDRSAFQFLVSADSEKKGEQKVVPVNPQAHQNSINKLLDHLRKKPITSDEMEKAIAGAAVSAHREGHLLISIAPDLTTDEAKSLLDREYRKHQKSTPTLKQRASFSHNWLDLISKFEQAEVKNKGAKSQLFVRYRRAIDGIRFTAEEDIFKKIGR